MIFKFGLKMWLLQYQTVKMWFDDSSVVPSFRDGGGDCCCEDAQTIMRQLGRYHNDA